MHRSLSEGWIDNLSSEDRVRAGAARLDKMLNQKQQGRLDGFFKVTPKEKPATSSAKDTKKTTGKRKVSMVCFASWPLVDAFV